MALTEDQRAMLQLLLERGQTYEDIGSLLGSDVGEIRSRARSALEEMGGADPDAEVSLTDYLLGQADPIGRADAARHLQGDPEARELASKLTAQLKLIAPGAELPEIPQGGKAGPSRFGAKPATEPKRSRAGKAGKATSDSERAAAGASVASTGNDAKTGSTGSGTGGLSPSQRKLIGAIGAAAAVVLVVVLLVAGVFGGGDSESDGDDAPATASTGGVEEAAQEENASNETGSEGADPQTVSAILTPVGDASPNAKGGAVFGQLRGEPVLQVIVDGLEPTQDGENYSIWLYRNENAAFRLSGVRVNRTKGIAAQVPVPRQVIRFVSDGTFPQIDISLATDAELQAQARTSQQEQRLTLNHIGESVLRGTIRGPGIPEAGAGGTGSGSTGATGPGG